MPKDEDFLEQTSQQYKKFYEQEGYTEEKIYALLPKAPEHYVEANFNELNICTELDIATLMAKSEHSHPLVPVYPVHFGV